MGSNKAWKQAERRAAAMVGAKRTPLSGGNSGGTRSDCSHGELYIEVKQRTRHAVWAVYVDAKDKAKLEKKIPVVVLDQKRSPGSLWCVHSDDLVAFATAILASQGGEPSPL